MKVIATSRERLNLQEEWLFPLQGLNFPKEDAGVTDSSHSAIKLLVQRARQVKRDFDPAAEAEAILQICRLVEGMPLGLELAAAWVSQLSCREIVAEIEREIDFLSSNLRNVPARHRSIRAVFAHSWQRLSVEERIVLQKLSVFRGGFLRDAAVAVANASLRLLAALVDKSMIRRGSNGRYHIHELMRQFAAEKLSHNPDLEQETEAKHGQFYLQFLAGQEERLHGVNGRFVLTEIQNDIDNIRSAWQWGVVQIQYKLLEPTLNILWVFYDAQGYYLEAKERFSQAYSYLEPHCNFAETRSRESSEDEICLLRIRLHALVGVFQLRLGRIDQAITILEESVSRITPTSRTEKRIQGTILLTLANAVHYRGEFGRERAIAVEAGQLFQELNDERWSSIALFFAGQATEAGGDYDSSETAIQKSYQIATTLGSQLLVFINARFLGKIAAARGNYQEAEKYLQNSLILSQAFDYPTQSMLHLNDLGDVARLQGQLDEAKAYYERSFAISSEMNSPTAMTSAYWGLGNLAWQEGNYAAAKQFFTKSKQTSQMFNWSLGGPGWVSLALGRLTEARQTFQSELAKIVERKQAPRALDTLAGLAHVQAGTGRLDDALELIALIEQHPATAHESKERLAELKGELIAELPPATVAAAEARGQQRELWQTAVSFLDNL